MARRTLRVTGMSCTGCEANVEDVVGDVEGVETVEADHEAGTVAVEANDDVDEDGLAAAVRDAGYEIAS